jgi:hypothetical protein
MIHDYIAVPDDHKLLLGAIKRAWLTCIGE